MVSVARYALEDAGYRIEDGKMPARKDSDHSQSSLADYGRLIFVVTGPAFSTRTVPATLPLAGPLV